MARGRNTKQTNRRDRRYGNRPNRRRPIICEGSAARPHELERYTVTQAERGCRLQGCEAVMIYE